MGDRCQPAPPQGPCTSPLSRERLARLLVSEGWRGQYNDDGDFQFRVEEDVVICVMLRGPQDEVLNVTGLMMEPIPKSLLDEARFAIDERHRGHLWPQCFWTDNEDAEQTFLIGAHLAVDWEAGVTDQQLELQIEDAVLYCV